MNAVDREAMKTALRELMTLCRQRRRRLSQLLLDEQENLEALEELYQMLAETEEDE